MQTARVDMGLSQRALAELVGVTSTAVSQWETRGSAPRSAVLLRRLEEALGIQPGRLSALLDRTPMPAGEPVTVAEAIEADPALAGDDRRLLLGLYRRLRQAPLVSC